MRGTPQTHLLVFSLLYLLSKVRGPRASLVWWGRYEITGKPPVLGAARFSPWCPDSCLWPALLCDQGKPLLLPELQLLPQVNGHSDHEGFVKIIYDNSPKGLSTGPGT